jgi:hypothetical protein
MRGSVKAFFTRVYVSGKPRFAKAYARRLGIPYIEGNRHRKNIYGDVTGRII